MPKKGSKRPRSSKDSGPEEGEREENDKSNWRAPDTSKQLPAMLKLVPTLISTNFEEWLRGLQLVAAQFSWYDPDSGDEWTPEVFDKIKHKSEDQEKKRQRLTAYTIIINTSDKFKYLYEDVTIGDACGAYKKICSLLNRSTIAGLIEANEALYTSSMAKDKVTVGEFAAVISARAKLVRKRGAVADEAQMITLLIKGLLPEFKTFKDLTLAKNIEEISYSSLIEDLLDFAKNDGISDLRHGGKTQQNVFLANNFRPTKSSAPCHFFQKGTCTRGDRCRFSHSSPLATAQHKRPFGKNSSLDKKSTKVVKQCDYCMRPGHSVRNCFKRKKDASKGKASGGLSNGHSPSQSNSGPSTSQTCISPTALWKIHHLAILSTLGLTRMGFWAKTSTWCPFHPHATMGQAKIITDNFGLPIRAATNW
jgi:hypothetical protein